MNILFLAVILAVFGGAIWAFFGKKSSSTGSTGTNTFGGGTLPDEPNGPRGPVEPM